MTQKEMKACLNCDRSEEKTPLLMLTFKGKENFICAQCLPLLIHKTHLLAEQFPGIELSQSAEQ
ncbi:MAG: hypothetical protein HYU84_05005 [Chloroflexi bacterium]|nr:hypothetical protein [Chloroflexota bacterium]MBI3168874.1 hypothetical protein [Chloroflexota bacterium]